MSTKSKHTSVVLPVFGQVWYDLDTMRITKVNRKRMKWLIGHTINEIAREAHKEFEHETERRTDTELGVN